MSLPRQILPGAVYLLTRRTAQRRFFLRPDPETNQIFLFCLAVAAERFGILIHAYCALSNHYHIVLTDPEGTLPAFAHWLNEYVAKCVHARLGRATLACRLMPSAAAQRGAVFPSPENASTSARSPKRSGHWPARWPMARLPRTEAAIQ